MARHRGRTMLSAMRSPNTRTLVAVVLLAGLAGAVATLALDRGKTTERVTTLVRPAPASTTQGDGAEWLPDLARRASAGVVAIQATTTVALPGSPFRPPSSQQAVAYGSGFVLDKQGHILTSDHIVESATKIHVAFADGSKVHAKLLGSDPLLDLAVLSVDVPKATLRPLPLGSADQLQLGDPVIAVGNPFELDRSVSAGIVSALHRAMVAPNGFTVSNAIQTDAAINHGNSGGPLLDAQGKVVGVAAQIADSGVDANVGVAFAVALDQAARRAIGTLEAGRTVRHAWLGVALANIDAILATSDRVAADRRRTRHRCRRGRAGSTGGTLRRIADRHRRRRRVLRRRRHRHCGLRPKGQNRERPGNRHHGTSARRQAQAHRRPCRRKQARRDGHARLRADVGSGGDHRLPVDRRRPQRRVVRTFPSPNPPLPGCHEATPG